MADHHTVFIGPCTAKRQEALADPAIGFVLTFEELGALFVAAGVDVKESPAAAADIAGSTAGRGFPVSGGVAQALAQTLGDAFHPAMVNGLDRKALNLLKVYGAGKCPGNFLEVMACEGGCIAGPGAVCAGESGAEELAAYTAPKAVNHEAEPVTG
jgi:iron only hydrogenase large subunit-like protein